MSKQLTINLNKELIFEAVKADTFLTGKDVKSQNAVQNASRAYNMQAGDDTYQERKLSRTLTEAVGALEANLAEFVDSAVDNGITNTLSEAGEDGAFTITVIVSDRYNSGLAHPIASLSQGYIVNKMLYFWWQPIDSSLAKDYLNFSDESLVNITRCLAKTAPATSTQSYEDVTGQVDGESDSSKTTRTGDIADYSAADDSFEVNTAEILDTYQTQGNVIISATDTSKRMAVKVKKGDTLSEPLFTISRFPYSLSKTDFVNLSLAVAGSNDAKIVFVPEAALDSSAKLIVAFKA